MNAQMAVMLNEDLAEKLKTLTANCMPESELRQNKGKILIIQLNK